MPMSESDNSSKRRPRLPEQSEWTFDLIEQAHDEIRRVADRKSTRLNSSHVD